MEKDSFLDTNIIINYVNFDKRFSKEITMRCYNYVINKAGKFILCGAVINELFKVTDKRSRIHKAVLMMIDNENYELKKLLSSKEIPFAKKLYAQFKETSREKLSQEFAKERKIFEIKIDSFLKFNVDEKVIPINEIDTKLVNAIYNIISNHADCKILASALQLKKERKNDFYLVTADAKDLAPNSYDFLKEDHKLKEYEFPTLKNLIFEKE
jgi:hypothetical protein